MALSRVWGRTCERLMNAEPREVKTHTYETHVLWNAAGGEGTANYRSYRRDHAISAEGKPPIPASSDPAFRGDASRYNPEELLVASISACHMLWYLHLCAVSGIVVIEYRDAATGVMEETADGSGRFTHVRLNPAVEITADSDPGKAQALHEKAHEMCFIARSLNFPVAVAGTFTVAKNGGP
jgi:organic hydroperoxide reductase OsmC/OhrA